ncbi:hypothetical protein BD410DRAFT_580873 [Rickenella mellea]|uniref:Methyltransferase domain-containing protein n=1 Tax=Rickenella mellea TaxID=50990 RepID=A0A4Y7PQD0_9AGAM|nr:hypothetical protein BD410DRAFT_580873 [Rickenella mellea]
MLDDLRRLPTLSLTSRPSTATATVTDPLRRGARERPPSPTRTSRRDPQEHVLRPRTADARAPQSHVTAQKRIRTRGHTNSYVNSNSDLQPTSSLPPLPPPARPPRNPARLRLPQRPSTASGVLEGRFSMGLHATTHALSSARTDATTGPLPASLSAKSAKTTSFKLMSSGTPSTSTLESTRKPRDRTPPESAKFSTADRTILAELRHSITARESQFIMRGGKKHHPYSVMEVPYPRSYERIVVDHDVWEVGFTQQLSKSVTFHTFDTPPAKVLEIGCGTGTWIMNCARVWKQTHFVGVDIVPLQPDLQRVGSSDIASRVTWVQANFLDGLPFPNDEFDFVHIMRIARAVPEDKWDSLIEEIMRVMKPGAAIEVIEEDLYFPGSPADPMLFAPSSPITSPTTSAPPLPSQLPGTPLSAPVPQRLRTDSMVKVRRSSDATHPKVPSDSGSSSTSPAVVAAKPRRASDAQTRNGREPSPHRHSRDRRSTSTTRPGPSSRPSSITDLDFGALYDKAARQIQAHMPTMYNSSSQTAVTRKSPSTKPQVPALRPSRLSNAASRGSDTHTPRASMNLSTSSVATGGGDAGGSVSALNLSTSPPISASTVSLASSLASSSSAHHAKGGVTSPGERARTMYFPSPRGGASEDPRDHSVLETIYREMHSARFINLSPLALLTNLFGLYFKDVRSHAPISFAFPPRAPRGKDGGSYWDSDDDDAEDIGLHNFDQQLIPKSADSNKESKRSAKQKRKRSIIGTSQIVNKKQPYIIIDNSRAPAVPRSAISRSPRPSLSRNSSTTSVATITPDDGQSPASSVSPPLADMLPGGVAYTRPGRKDSVRNTNSLPNQTLAFDLKSLNLHLSARVQEVLACAEAMWDWVLEHQAQIKRDRPSLPLLPPLSAISHPYLSPQLTFAHPMYAVSAPLHIVQQALPLPKQQQLEAGEDSGRDSWVWKTIRDMTRADFDACLMRFEMDMRDRISLGVALKQELHWPVSHIARSSERRSFDAACRTWDALDRPETPSTPTPEFPNGQPSQINAESESEAESAGESSCLVRSESHNGNEASRSGSSETTAPPPITLSRTFRVFAAWKAT